MSKHPGTTAIDECQQVRGSIARKADRYKRRARLATLFMATAAAAVPVFIGLSGDNFVLGKAVPSVLSASSAVVAALIGLERPHERWNLYRRYQRRLEGEEVKYRFAVPPYEDEHSRERVLASVVAQLQLDLHDEWAGLMPTNQELAGLPSGPR